MTESRLARNVQRFIPVLMIGLGVALITASAFYLYRNVPPRADVSVVPAVANYPAPELTLTDLGGVTHSLAKYRGQVVLVNLWATWCEPCKKEMPALQAFHDKYAKDGFTIIAINDGDPTEDVIQFAKDFELSFPIWLDPTYIATEQAFKTLGLPSSYVIDRNGIVRLQWMGGIEKRALEKYVAPIIAEEP
ncbi:MAG: TlpA disulfide reductase family protein [Anaerolineales bacterium]